MESTISSLIRATEAGDSAAADTLFSTLYSELYGMAKREPAHWGAAVSLNVTTLQHEAYLDISAREGKSFPDRPRISDALDELAEVEPRLAEVVDLKCFYRFSFAEIAA